MFSCGDNQYGQCGVYSADIYVNCYLHVTAIEGLQRTKTLVCGRDWTAGGIS